MNKGPKSSGIKSCLFSSSWNPHGNNFIKIKKKKKKEAIQLQKELLSVFMRTTHLTKKCPFSHRGKQTAEGKTEMNRTHLYSM